MFGFNRKTKEKLTEEQSELIAQAETLVVSTRARVKKEGTANLTSTLVLRDDCQLVEKIVKKLKANPDESNTRKLEDAIIRLKTTSENILR